LTTVSKMMLCLVAKPEVGIAILKAKVKIHKSYIWYAFCGYNEVF